LLKIIPVIRKYVCYVTGARMILYGLQVSSETRKWMKRG
jgi:hypothetical protein